MPTIEVTQRFGQTIKQTFTAAERPGQSDLIADYDAFDETVKLTGSTDPPATKKYVATLSGNQSLDLTALDDPEEGTVDGTGLKVQMIRVRNPSSTNPVDVDDGSANPYALNNGAAVRIPPGGKWMAYFADQLADIAAGAKAIDITATDSYTVEIVMG